MSKKEIIELPLHLGFIMDGNRRWAKAKGMPTFKGHLKGYDVLKSTIEQASDKNIKYVSFFAFSTENWGRSTEEVGFLMDLVLKMVTRDLKEMKQKGIKLFWLGSEQRLSPKLIKALKNAVEETKDNTKINVAICFNYGGHNELVEAISGMIKDGLSPADINEEKIQQYLYCPEVPPVDLVIRTSGEQRISNFMLWRAAYSELMFIDKHWPDFNEQDLDMVIAEYAKRQRRFGA